MDPAELQKALVQALPPSMRQPGAMQHAAPASFPCPKCSCPTYMEIGTGANVGMQRVKCICQARRARLADGTPVPHDRCTYTLKRLLSSFLGPASLGRIRSYHELMRPGRSERASRLRTERAGDDWKGT